MRKLEIIGNIILIPLLIWIAIKVILNLGAILMFLWGIILFIALAVAIMSPCILLFILLSCR